MGSHHLKSSSHIIINQQGLSDTAQLVLIFCSSFWNDWIMAKKGLQNFSPKILKAHCFMESAWKRGWCSNCNRTQEPPNSEQACGFPLLACLQHHALLNVLETGWLFFVSSPKQPTTCFEQVGILWRDHTLGGGSWVWRLRSHQGRISCQTRWKCLILNTSE